MGKLNDIEDQQEKQNHIRKEEETKLDQLFYGWRDLIKNDDFIKKS